MEMYKGCPFDIGLQQDGKGIADEALEHAFQGFLSFPSALVSRPTGVSVFTCT